jgi:hypothetical protein
MVRNFFSQYYLSVSKLIRNWQMTLKFKSFLINSNTPQVQHATGNWQKTLKLNLSLLIRTHLNSNRQLATGKRVLSWKPHLFYLYRPYFKTG